MSEITLWKKIIKYVFKKLFLINMVVFSILAFFNLPETVYFGSLMIHLALIYIMFIIVIIRIIREHKEKKTGSLLNLCVDLWDLCFLPYLDLSFMQRTILNYM